MIAPARTPRVLVAVLTYQRPDDLDALLPALQGQARQVGEQGLAERVEVLVVDNDPAAAAVARARAHGVLVQHEPRPGIAAARNRALAVGRTRGADVLVFIDDDERPSADWLAHLLRTFAAHPGAGVVGPVWSQFAVPLDPWIVAGGFFHRRRLPTGSPVQVAATNNLLLDLHRVQAAGVTFDERFGLTGGSDTLFTRRLTALAGPLIWCDEALVTDEVPAARCTRQWVLRRQVRSGNSWSRTSLVLAAGARRRHLTRIQLLASGLARVLAGLVGLLVGFLGARPAQRARSTRRAARGYGLLLGAVGGRIEEYARR